MAELELDKFESAKHMPAAKRAQFITARTSDRARRCIEERWSEERRICALGADDHDAARFECAEGLVATPDELAAMPPELACAVVAGHLATLMSAPDGKLGIVARKLGPKADLAELTVQTRTRETAACEAAPWSLAVRRCIVASKKHVDVTGCF
jgi:hypothetical protein